MGGNVDVSVILTATADQLRKELKSAGGEVTSFGEGLGSRLNATGEALRGLGGKMSLMVTGPLAALGGGMIALARKTANAGDEIAKASKSIGIDPGALQELRFAVGQITDLGDAELSRALENLNTKMGDLASGGASDELAAAFERVGVSAADIKSGAVGIDEAFARVNRGLQDTGSAAEAAATGAELLGSRVGRALGPQLREGGAQIEALRDQARDLGIVLSGEVLTAAEEFADKSSIINKQFEALGNAIGGALLPVLVNDLMPFMIDTAIPALIDMGEGIGDLIRWFTELSPAVKTSIGIVAGLIGVGGPILIALGALTTAVVALASPAGAILLAIAGLTAAWIAWGDDIQRAVGDTITWLQETFAVFGEWWNGFWNGLFEGFRATFGSAFSFITDTTSTAAEGVKSIFHGLADYLVFGSLIPDMWAAVKDTWAEGVAALKAMSADVSSNTTRAFTGMVSNIIGQFQTMLAAWESNSQAMFIAQRTAAIAQALVATFTGIAQALTWGWPMGPIFAAIIGGIGFAQVAAIAATSFGGSGSGGGGKGKGGGGGGGGGGGSSGLVRAAAQPPAAPAQTAQEASRTEITVNLEGGEGRRYAREEIELILEGINDALGDNATLMVRS